MKPTVSVVLLALAGQARGAELGAGECVGDGGSVEVKVGVEVAPVCVGAGGRTVLEFESAIVFERTVVEGGDVEPFTGVGGTKLLVDVAAGAAVGVARRVTVYFGDGFEPASATFPLVVVADSNKRVAKVERLPRTAASLREEVEDLTRRRAQCESRGATPTADGPAGVLPELLAQERQQVDSLAWSTARDYVVRPGFDGGVHGLLRTLLIARNGGRPEVAVRIQVQNRASEGWEIEEAMLVSSSGEALARVRTLTPVVIAPGDAVPFYVVSEPTARAVPGAYTLKLRGRGRELVLENVTFK
ncbi:DUF2381 family protein [Archangium lansingense]|uniref:DUF2381 family protein n=1 Tax=Archangium lansingense TaxID=2995310 RepID=A0ABT4AQ36_9BACT|nr:DUF2381 family protein [Archangium lansinium]MCY1083808.1 DUF2381 family protein [Archangium lansinium]